MRKVNAFVEALREFHSACQYQHSDTPDVSDAAKRQLWSCLISEETTEVLNALERADLLRIADGLADVLYVCVGAALAFGIPIEAVFDEVHKSNMSKVQTTNPDRRHDGKILRGADYHAPQIAKLLGNQAGKD